MERELRVTMPGIANRVRKASTARAAPTRGFLPSTVGQTSDYMSGSLAASAGGVMRPEMPSSAFKQRRVEMAEEEKGSVALRTVTYPIFAASTEATYTSDDGSSFVVSTQDAPMHIPGSATNLTASLVNASVPYVWDNLKEDQTVRVDGQFPRRVTLAGDKEISYTLTQPSATIQNTSGTVSSPPDNQETTNYLQDSDEQPFWFRPALEDAFVNMESGRLSRTTGSLGEWKDLTTSSGAAMKGVGHQIVIINHNSITSTSRIVGATVVQVQNNGVIAYGNVLGVPSATVTQILSNKYSAPFTSGFDITIIRYQRYIFGNGAHNPIIQGQVTISNSSITNFSDLTLVTASPQLTGQLGTGSPMLKFGQFDADPLFSHDLTMEDTAMAALRSIRSSFEHGTTTNFVASGILNMTLRFNKETLDAMNRVTDKLQSAYGSLLAPPAAENDVEYIKNVLKTSIVLCSFDITQPIFTGSPPSLGTRKFTVRVLLICNPRGIARLLGEGSAGASRAWRIAFEMVPKNDMGNNIGIGYDAAPNNVGSSGSTSISISNQGSIQNGRGLVMGASVRVNSSDGDGARIFEPCLLSIEIPRTGINWSSPSHNQQMRINVTLTQMTGGAAQSFVTNGTLINLPANQYDSGTIFGAASTEKNGWHVLQAENFTIGSSQHIIVQPTDFAYFGTPSDVGEVNTFEAVKAANFDTNLEFVATVGSINGNKIWETGRDYGFFVGDVFAVDNARLATIYGISDIAETVSQGFNRHKAIMNRYKDPLLQQFDEETASPFVALPSLDATTASEYTSLVTQTRSFKLPPGSYESVESYIEAVNKALSEDTASQCGLADLISLDIDHESMDADADRKYKLEVHYNRPISNDNPLLTATTTGSGAEPLLNQRVNINMGNLDTAFPIYTKVREAGDYVLLFADGLTAGQSPLDALLIHKPSLTVTATTLIQSPNASIDFDRILDVTLFEGKATTDLPDGYTGIVALRCSGRPNDDLRIQPLLIAAHDPGRVYGSNLLPSGVAPAAANGTTALTGKDVIASLDMISDTTTGDTNFGAYALSFFDPNNSNSVTNIVARIKATNADGTNDSGSTGYGFASYSNAVQTNNAQTGTTDFVILDMSFVSIENNNAFLAILKRRVSGGAPDQVELILNRIAQSGGSNVMTAVQNAAGTGVINAFNNIDLTLNRVGVLSDGKIGNFGLAARLPKITNTNRGVIPADVTTTTLGINIPASTFSSHNVAVLLKKEPGTNGGLALKYSAMGQDSVVSHDSEDGPCVRVLFSQTELTEAEILAGQQPEDQINLVMANGHVHVYPITARGIVGGDQSNKISAITDKWYEFANAPTASEVGITDAVSSDVHSAATPSTTEQHMFTVGEFTSYEDGDTSQALAAPNFLHRTSMNKAGNADIIRYFEDKKLPTKVVFNPREVMNAVWSDSEDDFLDITPYDNFEQDLINDADHNSKKYDMFDPRTAANQAADDRGDPLVTKIISESLTIPKGNYTFTSLGRAINELLHELDDTKFGIATIVFEDNASLRKLYASARLSNSFTDDLPSQIKLSWSSGPFANLFTESQILLQASGPDPRVYTEDVSYVTTGLQAVRTVYLRCNFVQGGRNPQRQKSQILASIPVDKEPGQTLVALPSVQLKVAAQNYLNQGDANTDLEFRITDEAGNPLAIGRDYSWSVNVLIEWEQDINLARLRQSDSETRHR